MIKKDLLEVLRDRLHCEYISDLRFVRLERVCRCIQDLDYNDFTHNEILDAVNYFGGDPLEIQTKEEAWSSLISLNENMSVAAMTAQ